MKTIFLLCLLAGLPLRAVTCASGLTHIVGVYPLPDGSPAYGKILVKGPSSPSGSVLSSTVTVSFGAAGVPGAYDFCLMGGVATKYTATYVLTSATGKATDSYPETWMVPATLTALTIPQLRVGSAAPQSLISYAQINAAGLTDGNYCFHVVGEAVIALVPCSGSSGGTLFDSLSGLFDSLSGLFDSL